MDAVLLVQFMVDSWSMSKLLACSSEFHESLTAIVRGMNTVVVDNLTFHRHNTVDVSLLIPVLVDSTVRVKHEMFLAIDVTN